MVTRVKAPVIGSNVRKSATVKIGELIVDASRETV